MPKNIVALVFACFAFLFASFALVGTMHAYTPIPFWDMWDGYLGFYIHAKAGDWRVWWYQHNEHRIVLSRFLFWLDFTWFNGRALFLFMVNYILAVLSVLLFWRIWRRISSGQGQFIGYFLIAWLFSWSQWENFTWAFQSQFWLAYLLPLASFYSLYYATAENKHGTYYFLLAVLLGVLSIGTMANGVLVLPLMVCYGLLVRMDGRRIALMAFLAAACLWVYFYNYVTPSIHGHLLQTVYAHPISALHYVSLFFGGPFFYFLGKNTTAVWVATLLGVVFILSVLYCAWHILRHPRQKLLELVLLIFIAYVGASALAAAGGRLVFGVQQALSSRYMTPPLMAWAALLLLSTPSIITYPIKVKNRNVTWVLFLLLVLGLMLPQQIKALSSKNSKYFEQNIAALAIVLGIKDEEQIKGIYPSPEILEDPGLNKAINQKLSIFGIYPFKELNTIIGKNIDMVQDHVCVGDIDDVRLIKGDQRYVKIQGWLFDPIRQSIPLVIYFIDNNKVVGVALTGQPRRDVMKKIGKEKAKNSGFKGYLISEAQNKKVDLFAPQFNCFYSQKNF